VDTDDPGTSQSRYVLGSPGYVAPERVMDITSGPAADFWSLGATLYAAVEGRNPFTRTSLMDTLSALVNDPPDPMRHAGPLAPVVTGLLRKDPRLRMGADEVSALLHRVADSDRGELRRLVPGQRTAATANTRTDRFRARWLRTPGSPSVGAVPLPENTTTVASRDVVTVARPAGGDDATRPAAGTWSSHRRRWAALSVAVTVTAVSAALIGPAHVHPGRGSVAVSASRDAGPTDVGIAGPSTAGVAEATAPGVRPTETDGVQLPVGWGWHHETAGFRFAAPQGWFTSRANSVTYFQEPHGERLLAIGRWTPAATDPVTAWTRVEAHAAELPRYQRIRIDAVPEFFQSCADWEYTHDGSGTRLRTISRGFTLPDGRSYVIMWRVPEFDWKVNLPNFWLVTGSFRAD
jgi:hypothetical protein